MPLLRESTEEQKQRQTLGSGETALSAGNQGAALPSPPQRLCGGSVVAPGPLSITADSQCTVWHWKAAVSLSRNLFWLGTWSAHLHKDHGSATDGTQKGISQGTNSESYTTSWHKIWSRNMKFALSFTWLRLPLNSCTNQSLIIGNSVVGAGVYPYGSTSHLESCRDRPRVKLFDRTLTTLLPG